MKSQTLGEIELDGVAPWAKNGARDAQDEGVLNDPLRARRAGEEPPETLGSRTIESAVAERSVLEVLTEVGIERRDL
jgi:hypothetical protein